MSMSKLGAVSGTHPHSSPYPGLRCSAVMAARLPEASSSRHACVAVLGCHTKVGDTICLAVWRTGIGLVAERRMAEGLACDSVWPGTCRSDCTPAFCMMFCAGHCHDYSAAHQLWLLLHKATTMKYLQHEGALLHLLICRMLWEPAETNCMQAWPDDAPQKAGAI